MNWKTLQILYSLYKNEIYDSKYLLKSYYGKTLVKSGLINSDGKSKLDNYDSFFQQKWLKEYESIAAFLIKFDLASYNFELEQIKSLVDLNGNKEVLLNQNISLKEISTTYFKSAKKIKEDSQLYKAILSVLGVVSLKRDEHDQQYLWVLHAQNKKPRAIILCENDNVLKKPRLKDIEIWYAGGNNTAKLQFVSEPNLPIYYLCDWDSNGLEIYQRIKKEYFPTIELIVPERPLLKKMKDNQTWKANIDESMFSAGALKIINLLRNENKWIEEESIKFTI